MQSNDAYGDVMPHVVGMFMLALGGVIFQFVRAQGIRQLSRVGRSNLHHGKPKT